MVTPDQARAAADKLQRIVTGAVNANQSAENAAVCAAAANDMLEALKTTAGNISSLGLAGALGPTWLSYAPWLAVVDAAIAKAEGRA
jgi:hypothetical protein